MHVDPRPCTKCGAVFVQTPGRAKRQNWRCSGCETADARARREAIRAAGGRVKRYGDPAVVRAREASYRSRPEVKRRRADAMQGYARDPDRRERHEARWAVRHAIAAGRLVRQPCEVCGEAKVDGHHDDYSQPLAVRWLCRTHHREWHASNTPIYSARCGGAK